MCVEGGLQKEILCLNPWLSKIGRVLLCFLLGPGASPPPTPQTSLCSLLVRFLSCCIWFWSLPVIGRNLFTLWGGGKWTEVGIQEGENVELRKGGEICRKWAGGGEFKGNFCPLCPRLKGFFMGPGNFKHKESELCQSISILLVMNYDLLPEQQLISCRVRALSRLCG